MARVLGIDTSSDTISVALLDNDTVLSESAIYAGDNSLKLLTPTIDYVLRATKIHLHDVDLISVVLGPGSWTGLRIGVETAKSISHALNIPIVGIYSLDALSANIQYARLPVWCALNARKGNVIISNFDCSGDYPIYKGKYQMVSIESFIDTIKEPSLIIGDGSEIIKKSPGWNSQTHILLPNYLNIINGRHVCLLGLNKFNMNGADNTLDLSPYYFQKTDAEIQWERRP